MFLCPSCEEFGFPTKPQSLPVQHVMVTRLGSNSAGTKSEGKVKQAKINQKHSVSSDTDSDDLCMRCHEPAVQNKITCDICHEHFHGMCTGISVDVYTVLMSIFNAVGWVCPDCRAASNSKLTNLQSSLSRTNDELSVMRALIADLKQEIDSVKANTEHAATTQNYSDSAQPTIGPPDALIKEISQVVSDLNRRKKNIIISGLPEPIGTNESDKRQADQMAFVHLCEEHLDTKPSLSHLGCRRLGKPEIFVNKPRKLLVCLTSETSASNILKSAKMLRSCDDTSIASHVYINPDLSPADSKIAFERRQRKRQSRQDQIAQSTTGTTTILLGHLMTQLIKLLHTTKMRLPTSTILKVQSAAHMPTQLICYTHHLHLYLHQPQYRHLHRRHLTTTTTPFCRLSGYLFNGRSRAL